MLVRRVLVQGVTVAPRHCRLLGLAGSVALALGGATAGALPVADVLTPDSGRAALGLVSTYFGLVLLIAAWWWLGRAVRGPRPPGIRSMLLTLAVWAAPLVPAPPLFSRDVYSYLAQGAMVHARIDVYSHGPVRLGGPLAAEVAPVWQHTPTPYGPVSLAFESAVAHASGAEPSLGVLGLRLVALLGVALMVLALPVLARRCGTDPAGALWLGALNPLLLLHLVGGAHNDAVMLGLLGAGLVAATGRWPACGAVLVTLAALVKAPAALGLLAVASLWVRRVEGRGRRMGAVLATAALALASTGAATAVTGTGYGWISALATPASPGNWALTSTLGRATGALLDTVGSGLAPLATPAWQALGLLATAVAVVVVWLRPSRRRPLYALGLSLTAVAVLGPALRPWYVLWGLFLIAAAAPGGPVRRAVAAGSAVLALAVLPSGFAPDARQLTFAVCGGALALLALWGARHAPGFATGPALSAASGGHRPERPV
ncbi:polyprenol phosphomannose-dependent alpha 1,6 mannosyltransferase MptB [Streptomyces sp. NA02950]|uniref:polyprenol phosphomannose-dependent alpha 1,6 mannosyltransferase MptB n=1 Tax=Streptomyces sp. NA02950 TaxID=2742137 RepID=UPI001590AC17|nr:polyprenol phosphomannose-dependent alpha 1,6 mannosyltransferase MptB [Streptomyces sp. NA02950]QKV98066.1 polyprenol phosphomannose-dependent alpha 1,6 mannosyltransferase MptB [Streptomyces sp. NA02950]